MNFYHQTIPFCLADIHHYLDNAPIDPSWEWMRQLSESDRESRLEGLDEAAMEDLSARVAVWKLHRNLTGLLKNSPPKSILLKDHLPASYAADANELESQEAKGAATAGQVQPGMPGYYTGLFAENARREDYVERAWKIRELYLQELAQLGGASCSSCARGGLVRKYERLLRQQDQHNS